MNKQPVTASTGASREVVLGVMRRHDILQVPIIDSEERVVKVEFLQDFTHQDVLENPVLVMAGGMGTRLQPLTKDVPKPMLKVGSKPILETIVVQLVDAGFQNLFISVCYMGEVIRRHFGNGQTWGINIEYLEEDKPLGTGGALKLLPANISKAPLLVMNGDILTKVNFRRLLEYHSEQKADLTICVRSYDFQVPYGVVEIDKNRVKSLQEKPIQSFFVNAGIYVVDNEINLRIKSNTAIDMPDIINQHIDAGRNISAFPIHEYWLDIGVMEQYKKAQRDIRKSVN
jgi:NDP-sugar pyrophosphorylase family protein